MEEKIQSLHAQIKLIKSKPGATRFPDPLKNEILELYQSSKQRTDLLRKLGLGFTTLQRWLKKENKNSILSSTTNTVFKTISISEKISVLPRIVFKNGIVIENVNEDFLLKVISYAISA